ncbi:hypothetical protein WJM97_18900 [Okeanomitos corallinicola TIOX110]|uniref:Uncharacterized protein n=1 Tax=Okeanomitos corallinicola TIOX110 TaxID=3133117 RepID=A0ABZ2UQ55_9CYAN
MTLYNKWEALANVHHSQEITYDQLYRGLLFNRCILQYHYLESNGESRVWYDIHHLIKGITTFQDNYNQLYPG